VGTGINAVLYPDNCTVTGIDLSASMLEGAERRLERRGVLIGKWEEEDTAKAEQRPQRRYYELTPVGEEAMADVEARFPVLPRLFEAGSEPA